MGTQSTYHNFDEGRIVYKTDGTYFAETYIKDHLGNIRVAYGNDGVKDGIRQVNAYYPFGMNMKELSANSSSTLHRNEYQYNGKMFQDELGLDWYDYGARFYDPVIGRWHSVDPLAEQYRRWSPYNFSVNNSLRFVDPDGQKPWDIIKGTALMAGGVAQWVGGVAAISTGIGTPLGIGLIMSGSATFAFGTAAVVNNGKKDIPTGMGQALGRGYDIANGGETHTGEQVGTVLDFGIGIPSGNVGATGNIISKLSNTVTAVGTIETIDKLNNEKSHDSNKSEGTNINNTTGKKVSEAVKSENFVSIKKDEPNQPKNPFIQMKIEESSSSHWSNN